MPDFFQDVLGRLANPLDILKQAVATAQAKQTQKTLAQKFAKPTVFGVGEGLTPAQQMQAREKVSQLAQQGAQLGVPVKIPFAQSAVVLPNNLLSQVAKGVVETPERLVNTATELAKYTVKGKVPPTPKTPFDAGSIQRNLQDAMEAYASGNAPAWTIPLAVTGAFADLSIGTNWLAAGVQKVGLPVMKAAVGELPESLLTKMSSTNITSADIIQALGGAEVRLPNGVVQPINQEALKFVQSLSATEKAALFRLARRTAGVSVIRTQPTALGQFAGRQTTQGALQTLPERQLPGFRSVPGQAPAFGLSTKAIEPVGINTEAKTVPIQGKKVAKTGIPEELLAEARKYKSAEEFVKAQRPEAIVDKAGRRIVGEKNGIKIVVNDTANPTYITLWDGEKQIGSLRTADKSIGEKGYLQVGNVEVNPKYRNQGLATEMYRTLLKYAPEDSKGLVGYSPDIVATKKIPAIYEKLGGKIDEATGNFKIESPKLTKSQLTDIWNKANAVRPETKTIFRQAMPPITPPTVRGNITPPELRIPQWKDKEKLSLNRENIDRNLQELTGTDYPALKEFFLEPVKTNETARTELVNNFRNEVTTKIVNNLGIRKGSKEDSLVQIYGEGLIDDTQLSQLTKYPDRIKKAANYFRDRYDGLLDTVNAVREKFGYTPIPKRKDYFRHFSEMGNLIDNIGLLFKPEDFPTDISGLSEFFQPGKPFTTAELRRKGIKTAFSAIKGFDNYIDSVSKQIFHIDSVQRGRALVKYIRESAKADENVKLPNLVANLHEYTDLLAGKQARFDRAFESMFGRKFYTIVTIARTRVAANMIGGNISSALTNYIPFTQLLATTNKAAVLRGILDSTIIPFSRDKLLVDGLKSNFLIRRYPVHKIDPQGWERVNKSLNWLFENIDFFTGRAVVVSKYHEGLKLGLSRPEAIKYADSAAAKILTDRSYGQLPNLFKSRTLGVMTQFQTEINNMASWITKDIPTQYRRTPFANLKIANALAQFALYSFLFNTAFKSVTGRRPTIDPIYYLLMLTGLTNETADDKFGKRIAVTLKEASGNLPFTASIASGRFPITAALPDLEALLRGQTSLSKELRKPLFYFAPPAGGGQIKKTIEGLTRFGAGRMEVANKNIKIQQNWANLLRGIFFGKYSFPEIVKYYERKY